MKALLSVVAIALSSCGPGFIETQAPDKLDITPIAKAVDESVVAGERIDLAVKEVRKATDQVKEANAKAGELTTRLKEAMHRTRLMADGNKELQDSLAASDAIIEEMSLVNMDMSARILDLQATVFSLEGANDALLKSNHTLAAKMEALQKDKDKQDIQIDRASDALKAASKIQPKLIIAESKLHWWKWRFLPISIAIAIFLLFVIFILILIIIYKPRIPLIS